MVIYLGADHRGFALKGAIGQFLQAGGYEVHDMGNAVYDEHDDYVDFAAAVAKEISRDPEGGRGILLCGSGGGMDIVADKFRGVRSILGCSADQVYSARHDDDVNVLTMAADFTNEANAKKMVQVFLGTPFGNEERYRRRLEKLRSIENG